MRCRKYLHIIVSSIIVGGSTKYFLIARCLNINSISIEIFLNIMGLLLRGCFLYHQKLFKHEIISLKHLVARSVYNNNVKKFIPTLQVKHFSSKKDEKNDKKLIYVGTLFNKIRGIRIFSWFSTALSVACQPIVYNKIVIEDNIAHIAVLFMCINLLCFGSPILIHMFTRRYVLKIYYNLKEGNYSAIVYKLFLKQEEIVFKAEDIKVYEDRTILSNCTSKGRPLLIDKDSFYDAKHYYLIMEQRKPEDLEVEAVVVHSINRPQIIQNNHRQIEDKHKKEQ